ncbi:MAG: hypothetical protein DRP08_04045 [Candidatus Aenigmatarchaeota archaeon]|nr:MAG: hypothetical protein DRP08_04045 [Candidatus Aenigmarchaeota archaeon]
MANIKLTLGQVEGLLNNEELKDLTKLKLPSASSFRLARALKRMEPEYETYVESKNDLFSRYAAKDDNDKIMTNENGAILFKDIQSMDKELKGLQTEELDLGVEQLDLKLKDCPEKISTQEIIMLLLFVKDPENFDKEETKDEPVVQD